MHPQAHDPAIIPTSSMDPQKQQQMASYTNQQAYYPYASYGVSYSYAAPQAVSMDRGNYYAPPPPTVQPFVESVQPHHHDVLMGRGGKNNQHAGNENLRDMARSIRDRYKASAKKGKSNMSRDLVQKVRELEPPGRFLKRDAVTNEWVDVGDDTAREKVSQVLRDAVSEWTGPKAAAREKDSSRSNSPPVTSNDLPVVSTDTLPNPLEETDDKNDALPPVVPAADSDDPVSDLDDSLPNQLDPVSDLDDSLPNQLDDSLQNQLDQDDPADEPAKAPPAIRKNPVPHVPFSRVNTMKRKTNMLERYSNLGMGVSDMSIDQQLSQRNLGAQLSSRQLMSTGTRQMSSRQLSQKQLSARGGLGQPKRQLSSKKLSGRHLTTPAQRKQQFAMMGESDLSLDSLNISGHSKQWSRKNIWQDYDGLSDFSMNSVAPEANRARADTAATARPSVIIEGDLEASDHSSTTLGLITTGPGAFEHYHALGAGTSSSNMTMNTIGTFSGHSRQLSSRGLFASAPNTGVSMRSVLTMDHELQVDMLDDEYFDEFDMDDDDDDYDEFSSEFC